MSFSLLADVEVRKITELEPQWFSARDIRLVLLDEAFSKMTSDRIRPMMELFRRLQLQVLLISTVEKSTAIQPYCDITYSIVRHGDANAIAPFVRLSAE